MAQSINWHLHLKLSLPVKGTTKFKMKLCHWCTKYEVPFMEALHINHQSQSLFCQSLVQRKESLVCMEMLIDFCSYHWTGAHWGFFPWSRNFLMKQLESLSRKNELTVEVDCLMWGIWAVVPEKLRSKLLEELHRDWSHRNVSNEVCCYELLLVARNWQGYRRGSKKTAKLLIILLLLLLCSHGSGILGRSKAMSYLTVVDAHSKWPEVFPMASTTTTKTVKLNASVILLVWTSRRAGFR